MENYRTLNWLKILFIGLTLFFFSSCQQNQNGIEQLIGKRISEKEAIRTAAILFTKPNSTSIKEIILTAISTPDEDVDLDALNRILNRKITGKEAIEAINKFILEPDMSGYCCGNSSCQCSGLGDCINLWFSSNCASLPGYDIVDGVCEKVEGTACTNDGCTCPS